MGIGFNIEDNLKIYLETVLSQLYSTLVNDWVFNEEVYFCYIDPTFSQ